MNKKVGVITLYDLNNYGNRLQNHAVIKCLDILGFQGETLIIERRDRFRFLKDYSKAFMGKNKNSKFFKFYDFSSKFTNPKFYFIKNSVINDKILNNYLFFSVGSDQVWNSKYLDKSTKKLVINERLLTFVEPNRRLSFSSSFALNDIPEEDKDVFIKELPKFNKILVRENRAKEIVEKLELENFSDSLSVDVILDPTMLLSKQYWGTIASDCIRKEDYILEVFICQKSELAKETINRYQTQNNYSVINIYNGNYGPREFIELISKAKYVFTDSFHVIAFSILFEKEFMVFERSDASQKNDSRFLTLFDTLNIQNRIVSSKNDTENVFDNQLDYNDINDKLNIARKKGWIYLKEAIRKNGYEIKDE